jgi:hypothetical protein
MRKIYFVAGALVGSLLGNLVAVLVFRILEEL